MASAHGRLRRHGKSSRLINHKKSRRHRSGPLRGYHQDQGHRSVKTITHTRRITVAVSRADPPLLPPLLLLECPLEPPITREDILTRASLAHPAPAIDSSTAVQHRRRHCRGHTSLFSEYSRVSVASLSTNAAQIAPVKNSPAPTPSVDDSHGVVPAAGTCALSVVPSDQISCFRRLERAFPATFPSVMVFDWRREPALSAPFPSPAA